MFTPSSSVKKQLQEYKTKNGLYKRITVSAEERNEIVELLATGHALPDGVYMYEKDNDNDVVLYYRIEETDLKDNEIIEFMLICQNLTLKSIKRRVTFLLAFVLIITIGAYILAIIG
ncbi:MAG: hypothetical protein WCN92_01975 [Eubacteriales bacterium]